MGCVLNMDQMKSVKQGEEIYLSKLAAEKAEEEEKLAELAAEAAALSEAQLNSPAYQSYLE